MARHLLTAAAVALALGSVACGSVRPPGSRFPRAVSPVAQDWANVLRRDAHVNLEIWETGRVRVKREDILDFGDPKVPARFAKDQLFVPVYAHLLRHDERGAFLIDAGLDRSFSRITSGDMRGLFANRFYAVQRPGEDVVSRLDIERIALRGIFFTHLHPDHVSGAANLPRDIPFIVGKGEKPTSYSFLFYNDALHDVIGLDEIDFTDVPAMPPLGPSLDVFGDGSVWAIHTPGHTNGHLSFVVVTKTGPVLFTGDVSHTRWGFDNDVVPGGFNDGDPKDSRRSLDQLRAFAKAYPEVRVVYGHEL
jgi:glyoxylase-like metal-dependent hydrolase (beta-lactamase superfamily II)